MPLERLSSVISGPGFNTGIRTRQDDTVQNVSEEASSRSVTPANTDTEELTEHLTAAHVGSGKPHYECLWKGCTRNGTNCFTSKRKICRHLQ
ncbi:hypothetical protein MPER_14474, partial [Moniliophthora perniciosa FA553]